MSTKIWLLGGALLTTSASLFSAAGAPDARDTARASARKAPDHGGYLTDAGITTKVKAALLTEKSLKSLPIGVETNDGVVTLSGGVRTAAEMKHAEDVARHVQGVRDVRNVLRLDANRKS